MLSAVLFLGFFLSLRRTSRFSLYGAAVSAVYGALSVMTGVYRSRFLSEYSYTDVTRRVEAHDAYLSVEILGVAEACALVALLVLLFFALRDFCREHLGASFHPDNKSLALSLQREYTKKAFFLCLFGMVSAVFFAAENFLLTLVRRHVVTEAESNIHYAEGKILYIPVFGGSWVLGLAFTALWVLYGLYFISLVRSELAAMEKA